MRNFKILLHVYLPVTAVFILNNMVVWTMETPGHLILNILSFGVVVSISILCLRNILEEKKSKPKSAEKVDEIYDDLKKLLASSCTKETLPFAKELARICSELGPVAAEMNDRKEVPPLPQETPFRKGSLRRAYGYEIKKAA